MARLFQIVSPSWRSAGTSMEGDSSSSSARTRGSLGGMIRSAKSRPENFVISQPRSDHDE